jgi:hypothetical protein
VQRKAAKRPLPHYVLAVSKLVSLLELLLRVFWLQQQELQEQELQEQELFRCFAFFDCCC